MNTELHGARKVIGLKQLRRALQNGQVAEAFAAQDAEPRIVDPVIELCRRNGVHVTMVPTMAGLGHDFGIEVGAAVAGILR